jgi:hypothetical protein
MTSIKNMNPYKALLFMQKRTLLSLYLIELDASINLPSILILLFPENGQAG